MSFRILQQLAADRGVEFDIDSYVASVAITEIDLPALSAEDAARFRAIAAEARDYARSYPAFSSTSTIECPECDGTGVYLIGCIDPDDLIEQRCVICLGAGVIDISEAVTQPLEWGKP